jgi:hypothetical protein
MYTSGFTNLNLSFIPNPHSSRYEHFVLPTRLGQSTVARCRDEEMEHTTFVEEAASVERRRIVLCRCRKFAFPTEETAQESSRT